MQDDLIRAFESFGKQAMESAKEVVECNSTFLNQILDAQVSLANLYVESSEKQLGLLESIKDPQEYISLQTQVVQEYAEKIAAAAQRNVEISQQAGEQVKEWVQQTTASSKQAFQSAMDAAKSS